jgi:hypothetical protein
MRNGLSILDSEGAAVLRQVSDPLPAGLRVTIREGYRSVVMTRIVGAKGGREHGRGRSW